MDGLWDSIFDRMIAAIKTFFQVLKIISKSLSGRRSKARYTLIQPRQFKFALAIAVVCVIAFIAVSFL